MQTMALKHTEMIFSNTTYVALGECVIQFSHKTRGPKIRRYREDTVAKYRGDTAPGRDFGEDTAKIRRYGEDTVDNIHFPFL